eukprot:943101-Prymnesium_polylepis.1
MVSLAPCRGGSENGKFASARPNHGGPRRAALLRSARTAPAVRPPAPKNPPSSTKPHFLPPLGTSRPDLRTTHQPKRPETRPESTRRS